MSNILDKINQLTRKNGEEYYNANLLESIKFDLDGPLHKVTAICNGFLCSVEIKNDSIFSSHCQCIIGKNGVICKHVTALVFAYLKKYQTNKVDKFEFLNNYTNNIELIKIINDLSQTEKLFTFQLKHFDINLEFLNKPKVESILSYYDELIDLSSKLAGDKNIQQESHLEIIKMQNKFQWIYTYNEIINNNLDLLNSEVSLDEIIENLNDLFQVKINNELYQLPIVHNQNGQIDIFANKTSLGYMISSNIKDGSFITVKDDIYFFLIISNEIQWFKSNWNNYDNPNLIFKLNLKTKNENLMQSKLLEIKETSLFVANLHLQNLDEVEKNRVIFGYDIPKQKCLLTIYGPATKEIIKKYFSKYTNDFIYEENNCSFYVDNKFEISDIFNKLSMIKKNEKTDVIISQLFTNKKKHSFNYHFKWSSGQLHLDIDNQNMDEDVLEKVFKAYNSGKKYYVVNDNLINLDELNFEDLKSSFNHIDGYVDLPIKKQYNFNITNIFYLQSKFKNKELKEYIKQFYDEITNHKYIDENFIPGMKQYQVYGCNWLINILNISHGCILADEMGLGKTVQTIAMLKYQYQTHNDPTIIILPLSLVSNWMNEFKRFYPEQKIVEIVGNSKQRAQIISNIEPNTIYLTTYNLVNNDIEQLNKHKFLNVILDEGQYIKNFTTTWTLEIKKINSTNKIILSATPIENNLLELWSIFDFILPGYLVPLQSFKKIYMQKGITDDVLYELSLKIKPFILQRKKIDHLDLPTKSTTDIVIEMSELEKKTYKNLLNYTKERLVVSVDKDGNLIKNRIEILSLITKLRQFCCSPSLINITEHDNTKLNELLKLVTTILDKDSAAKIVIFSNFSTMLNMIFDKLIENGYNPLIMTGENKTKERDDIIDEFNKNLQKNILLLSLKVGGVGLNLTVANNVIHYNPWWNESVEIQATDRLHRIGQEREINVFKLIYKDSIEFDIQNIKNSKNNIINKAINHFDYKELLKIIKDKNI